jgi:hypothetical protein
MHDFGMVVCDDFNTILEKRSSFAFTVTQSVPDLLLD